MSTSLALNNANGDQLFYDTNYYNYYPQPPYYPGVGVHWPTVYPTTTIVITTGHRTCGCPKCTGCCDCADCKIKKLEKRVAELEAKERTP